MGEIRIFIRQKPITDEQGNVVHYDGTSPFDMHKVNGWNLSPDRYWGPWKDVTDDSEGADELAITHTLTRDQTGTETPGTINSEKKATSMLTFYGETYKNVKAWLVDDISAPLNGVDVKFYDEGCGAWLSGFFFDGTDIEICEGELCSFSVSLREADTPYQCIHTTLIADNWRGEFQEQPTNGKKHPRFSYCNERRPNGLLVFAWHNIALLGTIMPIVLIIATIVMFIIDIVKAIVAVFTWIFGGDPDWPDFAFKKDVWDPIIDAYGQWFVEGAGCGREHPAPLVRDYIKSVCDKCGVRVDGDSAPIFFAETIEIETNSRGSIQTRNPHYNVCLLWPISKRGVRRFKSQRFIGQFPNDTDYYIVGNAPSWTLSEMLDALKDTYNAAWHVKDNKLYFDRKDRLSKDISLYNFKPGSPDRNKIVEGVCFEWNELRKAALTRINYQTDAGDKPGNESGDYYSAMIRHGYPQENGIYSGKEEKPLKFGAVAFRLDGSSDDYIYDAFQVVVNSGWLNGIVPIIMFSTVKNYIIEFCDYAILMRGETSTLPKLVIWDGDSYDNARAEKNFVAHNNAANDGDTIPTINPNYNLNMDLWQDIHHPNNYVRGSGMNPVPNNAGYYTISNFTGLMQIKQKIRLMNYHMFVAPGYNDTLWDWFHWIDDPNQNRNMNMEWRVRIEKCCDDMLRLGLVDGPTEIALGAKVFLPARFHDEGIITTISLNCDPNSEFGPNIEIKGTL